MWSRRITHGFTLLEVMVALAIFATAAIAITQVSMQYTKATTHGILRTQAHMLAMNQAALMQINELWLEGTQTETLTAYEQQWQIVKSSEATISPNVRRIQIQVNLMSDAASNTIQGIHTLQYFHRKVERSS